MQQKFGDRTPLLSPRASEEQRLRAEANGTFAPAKPSSMFYERRKLLIEEFVAKGLRKFDEQEKRDTEDLNQQGPGKGCA